MFAAFWRKNRFIQLPAPFFFTVLAMALIFGCAQMKLSRNSKFINDLQTGVDYATVVETMGEPLIQKEVSDHRFVAYYQTKPGDAGTVSDPATLCVPIGIENFKVAGVGTDLYEHWVREEKARVRRVQLHQARRKRAQLLEVTERKRAAEREKKIAALEKEVTPVPASNASLNLKLYRQLLELDPGNKRYQKKVSYYEKRLARQKKAEQVRAEKRSKEKARLVWEKNRPARNQRLGRYTGNGTAEMAVYDMGNHSLYVWVKNISQQIITTHPDYFTLMDDRNNKIPCLIDDSLHSVLEPGGLSHGGIVYHPDRIPEVLIFQNNESGRVSKPLQ